ncbi:MAG: thioredoxin family protein [Gaiellaceae bacterium]
MTRGADSSSMQPRLLFFYDPSDGRARRVERYLAQVLQKRKNHEAFVVRKVDISDRPDLAQRFRVESGALLVVDGNQIRGRLHEPRTVVQIRELLEPWLR